MEKVRLDKILSKSGLGSRNDVKKLIKQGRVTAGGKPVKSASDKYDPAVVEFDGQAVNYREFVYIIMNKPAGVISATEDNLHTTVIDLLGEEYASFDMFPVGRLDIDTEGLLLITNDGKLAHELLSPAKHIPKTYYARLDKKLSEENIKALESGVDIGGYITKPAEVEICTDGAFITIYEGKFHQVKKMFSAVGATVLYLKRISMGTLTIPEGMEIGQYAEVSRDVVQSA